MELKTNSGPLYERQHLMLCKDAEAVALYAIDLVASRSRQSKP